MKDLRCWKDILGFEGRYQMTEAGDIRTASKKPKKTIVDRRGKGVVVIDDVAYYIDELVAQTFGISTAASSHSRSKYKICREDNGEEYPSISAAAKANNFNYDKFYNLFYLHPDKDFVVYEDITFRKVAR